MAGKIIQTTRQRRERTSDGVKEGRGGKKGGRRQDNKGKESEE